MAQRELHYTRCVYNYVVFFFTFSARSISEEFSSGDASSRYRDAEECGQSSSSPHTPAPRDRQDKTNKDKEDRDEGIYGGPNFLTLRTTNIYFAHI